MNRDFRAAPEPVLDVRSLSIAYRDTPVVTDVSFAVHAGEKLAIVGESGSGKSTLTGAVLGLLPATARVRGSITLAGTEVVGLGEPAMRGLRGDTIAYVPQDPMSNLNPGAPHRSAGRRGRRSAPQTAPRRGSGACAHSPAERGPRQCRIPLPAVPPRALRGYEAARTHRHGHHQPPTPADRR